MKRRAAKYQHLLSQGRLRPTHEAVPQEREKEREKEKERERERESRRK